MINDASLMLLWRAHALIINLQNFSPLLLAHADRIILQHLLPTYTHYNIYIQHLSSLLHAHAMSIILQHLSASLAETLLASCVCNTFCHCYFCTRFIFYTQYFSSLLLAQSMLVAIVIIVSCRGVANGVHSVQGTQALDP